MVCWIPLFHLKQVKNGWRRFAARERLLNTKPTTMSLTVSCAERIFMMYMSVWKDFLIGIFFQDKKRKEKMTHPNPKLKPNSKLATRRTIFFNYDEMTWDAVADLPRDTPLVLPLGSDYNLNL